MLASIKNNIFVQRLTKFFEKKGMFFSRSFLLKKFQSSPKRVLLITTFLLIGVSLSFLTSIKSANVRNVVSPTPFPTSTPTTTPSPTITPTSVPPKVFKPITPIPTIKNIIPTPTPVKSQTNNATAPTATPTPAPARTANPPQVEILFPSEGQVINYSVNNNSRNICVGYVSRGGDTTDSKFKYSLDGSVWSGYMQLAQLCYDAHDGVNTVQMQFTNRYNEESSVITRTFVFENN
jgi:hypothetical protein